MDVLLRALALLRDDSTMPTPSLTLAGDGPSRRELTVLAQSLGVEKYVRFIGWTDDVAAFWAEHHLAVAPSYELLESFGMAVIEAMACARPSIVSDRGALPELVDLDVTGAVVAAGDALKLAKAIDSYRSSPDLLSAHGIAAYEQARRRFTLERCADDYLNLADTVDRR
jgi:rhamnosyl/mannosyltransferase